MDSGRASRRTQYAAVARSEQKGLQLQYELRGAESLSWKPRRSFVCETGADGVATAAVCQPTIQSHVATITPASPRDAFHPLTACYQLRWLICLPQPQHLAALTCDTVTTTGRTRPPLDLILNRGLTCVLNQPCPCPIATMTAQLPTTSTTPLALKTIHSPEPLHSIVYHLFALSLCLYTQNWVLQFAPLQFLIIMFTIWTGLIQLVYFILYSTAALLSHSAAANNIVGWLRCTTSLLLSAMVLCTFGTALIFWSIYTYDPRLMVPEGVVYDIRLNRQLRLSTTLQTK